MKFVVVVVVAVLVVVAFVVAVLVLGAVTPRKHQARVSVRLKKPIDDVARTVTDIAQWPTWNPAAKTVEKLADINAHPAWKIADSHGNAMPYEIVDASGARLVTRIADESLPFGGTWTWSVAASNDGTDVVIVEDGVIKNVVFRALARTVFGYTTTQKTVLRALATRFGESDAPLFEEWTHVSE